MKTLRILAFFAMILAFLVITLGAFTRLTDAGLGCPDWPGCYGHMVLPSHTKALHHAQQSYPGMPIEGHKAWTEMSHRYAAGTLAFLILTISLIIWRRPTTYVPRLIPAMLLSLIGFQAALGMWTVTLKLLPIVVMGHLLGGLLIFGVLVYLNLLFTFPAKNFASSWRLWMNLAVIIVFCQIALGGWVSSNYAGLACIGFPQCNGQWLPAMTWDKSFQLSAIGFNYQGGLLDSASRVTIQIVHRMGAIITVLYMTSLAMALWRGYKKGIVRGIILIVVVCLIIQFALGIGNVIYLLPLWIAVAHNGVAALLFAAVISLRYFVLQGGRNVRRI